MSNSQEQSLNENAVFLPVDYTSPGFLHCEKERQRIETLLSAGPESFYSSTALERSGCFISPEEVIQIAGWAKDYRVNHLKGESDENGEEGSSETEDFHSTYFPCHSEAAPPDLDLGWPEKKPYVPLGSVTVHTNPPAEGEPSVREIIRRHLQRAREVIAVVTDRLTDGPIIADLHKTASRGVPIYIILNQRSTEENFTLTRLMHPNMRVRVLQGRTFCSRTGTKVVGEMKNKFLLVDLETVIHGSYSLTWTDAHLHRQLITVLCGPVVDTFDREFRMLFAASLPVPEKWRVTDTCPSMTHQLEAFSDPQLQNQLSLSESEDINPPSPPADLFLDWEELGIVQRQSSFHPLSLHEELVANEMALQNNMLFNKDTHIMDSFTNPGYEFLDMKRECENRSPVTNALHESTFKIEKAKQVSLESNNYLDDRTTTRLDDAKTKESSQGSATSKSEPFLEEDSSVETSSPADKPKKPLILRLPQSENHSVVSDILMRLKTRQSPSGLFKKRSKAALSEMSQSMMDLSVVNSNPEVPVPRIKYRPGHVTPAYALMKNRNIEMISAPQLTPKTSLIGESLKVNAKKREEQK
ncbi:hypothetical protein Q5P01_001492 [Channa striata]|uniref:Scaffolding anchor of CK1 domain-containing protein n=1 Tax=Channa striata TaxID=64152 RepID=A0AA88NPM7_CHASR|nr:hypothetical protein Q5P01_001492 [Channa striata]